VRHFSPPARGSVDGPRGRDMEHPSGIAGS
jgi:hypothetical protein